MRPDLSADLQYVAEPFGCNQTRLGALSLDHQISRDRRTMADMRNVGRVHLMVAQHIADTGENGLRGVMGRRWCFVKGHRAVVRDHRKVGKSSTDVYPYSIHVQFLVKRSR